MAAEVQKYCSKCVERVHIRILYFSLLVIVTGTVLGFWICFTEVQKLRKDLNAEIAKRTVVDFSRQKDGYTVPLQTSFEALERSQDTEVLFSFKRDSSPGKKDTLFFEQNPDPLEHEDSRGGGEDQLLRVRRDAQKLNAFYKEGSGIPDDHVWMTSYAKVPVSILHSLLLIHKIKSSFEHFQ